MKDERVISVMRQAQSGGFAILFFGLLFVMFYRGFYLQQSFQDYGDVFVVWLAAGVYMLATAPLRGVDMTGDAAGWRKWRQPLGVGLGIVAIQLYNNIFQHDVTLSSPAVWLAVPISFIAGFTVTALVQGALGRIYRRWERKHLED